ncbi:TerB N-terminal domain-containing protein [Paenibacillus ihumii]|uniref:TerB N-terminal domain-containing protein n=1 Tax=Paenibacillus ihumii TaxID=687436 RepID=UPI0006D7ECE7|nr:TerB N-terminal domain-containing protein [Paenibacillus ihumii]
MNDRRVWKGDALVDRQRRGLEQQPAFAEIELGEPERKPAEPLVVIPERGGRDVDWGQAFRYVSRERQFVEQAREWEWKSGAAVEFVPFHAYWPTYEQMQPGQLKWYLYWRGEVRSGRYPDTDLSYLFVYLYELIHGIGSKEPTEGYELMQQVWIAYRERYPKLDAYVREWLYDYALVFGLDMPPPEPLRKLPRNLSPELRELEWKRRFAAEPLALTWDMLRTLIDYDVEKSRFCTGQGRKELHAYAPKVVTLVDSYLSRTEGTRLLERCMPRESKASRVLFRTAVYDHELYGRSVTVSVLPISGHPPLRAYLTQLVRLTENRLREFTGFRGKLRGITVEPEVDQLVTRFLRKEFEQRKAEGAKARLPRVKINAAKLHRIQRESDEVRDMLLLEEQALEQMPLTGMSGEEALPPQPAKPVRELSRESVEQPQQAEIDFERGWAELEEADPAQERTAESYRDSEEDIQTFCYPKEHTQAFGDSEESTQTFYHPGKDTQPFGDPVGPSSAASTHRDGGLLNAEPNGRSGRYIETAEAGNETELPQEWRELFARLSSAHIRTLAALLDGEDAAVRFGIAEQAGSMPELLLDEINEIAMELIGDLLIDGEEIAEEYRAELEAFFGNPSTICSDE